MVVVDLPVVVGEPVASYSTLKQLLRAPLQWLLVVAALALPS